MGGGGGGGFSVVLLIDLGNFLGSRTFLVNLVTGVKFKLVL